MDEITIKTYNEMAEKYDAETRDFWERFSQTFLDAFIHSVPPQGKVLDVGSGPGRDGLLLQEAGLDVTCLDASETMVGLGAAKGLKTIQGDFMRLPFSEKTFDGAWAYTALLHAKKSEIGEAMREIYRVLKDDGVLGLGMIEGKFEGYRESSGVNQPRWFVYYTKEELEKLLKENDFEIFFFEPFNVGKTYLHFLARKVANPSNARVL